LSPDHDRWIPGSRKFLLPVKVLSARFRRLFLDALAQAHANGELQFFGDLVPLRDPSAFARCLAPLEHKKWVVYAKAPFGGPHHVLEYLGRYTHRVAISNRRLLTLQNGQVAFEWKDYRDAGQSKVMTVPADDFIRRFLQHVVPPGLQRIRYYGFLANCHRQAKLTLCRQLLATACSQLLPQPADCRDFLASLTRTNSRLCPQCGQAILIRLQFFPPCHGPVPLRVDSS
jgi:Putative transposase